MLAKAQRFTAYPSLRCHQEIQKACFYWIFWWQREALEFLVNEIGKLRIR